MVLKPGISGDAETKIVATNMSGIRTESRKPDSSTITGIEKTNKVDQINPGNLQKKNQGRIGGLGRPRNTQSGEAGP